MKYGLVTVSRVLEGSDQLLWISFNLHTASRLKGVNPSYQQTDLAGSKYRLCGTVGSNVTSHGLNAISSQSLPKTYY